MSGERGGKYTDWVNSGTSSCHECCALIQTMDKIGHDAWHATVGGSRGTTLNVPTGTPSASTPSHPQGWNEPVLPQDTLGQSPVPERFRSTSGPN